MTHHYGLTPRDIPKARAPKLPRGKVPVLAGDPTKALIKAIAMDIGKEVVHRIETMYPQAIEATAHSCFKLHVRNSIYNEIMAAIEVTDEGKIIARLADRKTFRRKINALYKNIRTARPKVSS